MDLEKQAKIYKALSEENRLRIIGILQTEKKCACEILDYLEISQSTLSHHMKILCECGLVECQKKEKWSYYNLSKDMTDEIIESLQSLFKKKERR
ncbi:winged helix-turn-helix transcriptional regulator [Anaerococcus sp. AGMB00486]|uniref:Winged helix-turn-helix transcriptional regulator n=2 Tax=Anaerococcus TaxID=165779 RepID=A0ABX2NCS4_9FIRM|nr:MULTISPECIES: metalloregulator ArsR/SmtB family transcription factor [Anaerococcus]MSS77844.1 winged helix-turn-helix transcriptional regulator [Anaerococcus porci]NVF12499.1 winged helix-turn-helix transcriptional regulator [Anaerococcus faecalis]